MSSLVVGHCLATTALGTILPIVRDAGLVKSEFGARVWRSATRPALSSTLDARGGFHFFLGTEKVRPFLLSRKPRGTERVDRRG
jgi:hypothetical protein